MVVQIARFDGSGIFPSLARSETGRAHVAQLVEHVLGKDEVTGSIPVMGSRASTRSARE